ncbi:hypothetical protein GCM10007276_31370 [Agaricicola taiwanensis]|uniref:Secretin/TonB short N-terminal domain-containing protein n=1 Tax=Agaricicola taiwanensis TaxID=591372 RepID=A0A8J3DZR7_9RHOB|nr:TonB-dependent receptor [Agaricicola taiwanensis]GGE52025.1 hypothetical protein GCM10007276_31370 [Agaricicola taiwanensis]
MTLRVGARDVRHAGRGLLIAALMGSTFMATGMAVLPVEAQAQSARQAAFNIPAGPLSNALVVFGRQAGLQVSYLPEIAAGRQAAAVSGTVTPQEALSRLLQNSGLTWSFTGAGTVTITDRSAPSNGAVNTDGSLLLDVIDVTGRSGSAPADVPFETPGSSAHISREQIDRFRGSSPGDIFKGVPGVVAAGGRNGTKLDVNIRGMQGQGRVKVSIDGTQQSSTTWRGYQGVDERVYIDPDLIGGVDITKGPSGGAEGAGSPGGVVAIRTLNAGDIVEDGREYGVRLRAGVSDNADAPLQAPAYNQRTDRSGIEELENKNGSAAFAVSKENFDVIFAAAHRQRGNYFAGTKGDRTSYLYKNRRYDLSFTKPGEEVFNTSEDSFSALAKATLRWGEGHSVEFGYVHFESEFGESMGSMLFQQDNGFRQVSLSDITTDTYTARYRWNPGSDWFDLRFNVWGANVEGTTRAVAAAPDFSQWGLIPADEPRYSETWTKGADITNTTRFDTGFGHFRFDYGLSYLNEEMNGREYCSRTYTSNRCVFLNPSVGSRSVGSLFSTGKWEITDWLTVDGGLRYDTYELEDNGPGSVAGENTRDSARLSPSIGLTLEPVDGIQFFTRYAEGMRPPTLRETMGSDANAVPNPDLEPEVTKSWEVGMNLKRDGVLFDEDKARFKLAWFRNNHDNYISRVVNPNPRPGAYVFSFANLDRVMFSGIEVSAGYDTGKLFANATLMHYGEYEFCRFGTCGSETINTDYAVAHIPAKHSFSFTLGARLFDERLVVGGRIMRSGARLAPITQSDRQRTPMWLPYSVVDAFASVKLTKNLTLDVQAENLLDRYYIDALDGWVPAPGRTVRASLTAKF